MFIFYFSVCGYLSTLRMPEVNPIEVVKQAKKDANPKIVFPA